MLIVSLPKTNYVLHLRHIKINICKYIRQCTLSKEDFGSNKIGDISQRTMHFDMTKFPINAALMKVVLATKPRLGNEPF